MSRNFDGNGFDDWGGYMDAKITKLEEQFTAASDPFRQTNLFAGISIYVNGRTDPSADELKRIMMVHGGIYHHYERSHTTYIIASMLPDVKVRNMNTSKIISAKWVVDCIREKRILDYTRYLLYTNQKTTQPCISFKNNKKEFNESAIKIDSPKENSFKAIINEDVKVDAPLADVSLQQKPLNISSTNTTTARTAVDPKFLAEFYNNSRLHHIATLGAGFKQYVGELREKHSITDFPARQQLIERLKMQNIAFKEHYSNINCIMHIDMDCFFVSVGLRTHPHLRGQPIAVTHSKGGASATDVPVKPGADRQLEGELFAKRFEQHLHNNILSDKARNGFDAKLSLSEIASCSYEARAKGIHNGMFVGHALKLCPDLKTIPYDFEGYKEVAYTLYNTIAQYTLNIEAVSCDEMFVDLTDVLKEIRVDPMDFVRAVREEVRRKTGCPCSAGVGANKLQARMATKQAKPDGQYHLIANDVEAYMSDIPINDLPGVGSSTTYNLKKVQLFTCGDLQKITLAKLQMHVGKKFGETLYQFCRGIDNRNLVYEQIRKSISAEVNYGIRFTEYSELETFLKQLCAEVHNRLNEIKRKTKCITLKLMVRATEAPVETSKFMGHGVCDHITKSISLSDFTNNLETITRTILTTMKALALPPNELRGIGIQLTRLDEPNEVKEKKENVIKNMFSKVVEKQKEKPMIVNDNEVELKETEVVDEPTIKKMFEKVVERQTKEPKIYNNNEVKTDIIKQAKVKPTIKKGRGRPPAINDTIKESTNKRPNVLGMLQNAAIKKQKLEVEQNSPAQLNDIDPDVWSNLPADIQAEILRDRSRKNKTKEKTSETTIASDASTLLQTSDFMPTTSKAAENKRLDKEQLKADKKMLKDMSIDIDEDFLNALPNDIRTEIINDLIKKHQEKQVEKVNVLEITREKSATTPSPNKIEIINNNADNVNPLDFINTYKHDNVKEMFLNWILSTEEPIEYDIELLSCHACDLVRKKEIMLLYEPLLYLCRIINSRRPTSCNWHAAYCSIIDAIQLEMFEVYDGRKFYLGDKLICNKCLLKK